MEGQIKGMSDISYGGKLAILRIHRWCRWYRILNRGKLPDWLIKFTDEALFDYFQYN